MALRIYQQPEEIASYPLLATMALLPGYLPVVQADREPAASFAVAVEDIGKEKEKTTADPHQQPKLSVMYRESSGQRELNR